MGWFKRGPTLTERAQAYEIDILRRRLIIAKSDAHEAEHLRQLALQERDKANTEVERLQGVIDGFVRRSVSARASAQNVVACLNQV